MHRNIDLDELNRLRTAAPGSDPAIVAGVAAKPVESPAFITICLACADRGCPNIVTCCGGQITVKTDDIVPCPQGKWTL